MESQEKDERRKLNTYEPNSTLSVASYTPQTRFDYGALVCWAENEIGKQSEPCVFNIIPASEYQSLEV